MSSLRERRLPAPKAMVSAKRLKYLPAECRNSQRGKHGWCWQEGALLMNSVSGSPGDTSLPGNTGPSALSGPQPVGCRDHASTASPRSDLCSWGHLPILLGLPLTFSQRICLSCKGACASVWEAGSSCS